MSGEKRNSFAVILLLCMIVAQTSAQENITATTSVLQTTTARIESFSVETGQPVRFIFTVKNSGNTNISIFPEITVYDSNNNNTIVKLVDSTAFNISIGSLKDLIFSWNTNSTGNFRAQLVVFYDNNSRIVTSEKNFSIFGHVRVPASSSGDGGTGGGTISKEPPDNLNLWETQNKDLQANIPTSYIFTTPELDVYEILINPSKDLGVVSLRVELLKGLSSIEGIISPPGEIYKFINIWFDYVGFEKQNRDAIIGFRVDNNWIAGKKIEGSSISLLRWDGKKWSPLETQLKDHDEKYTYYQAKTNSFGAFAISSISPYYRVTPEVQITETPIFTPIQTRPIQSKFYWLYSITAFILFLLLFLFLKRRRKK
jgi:PGF-pre-PGF domain-containing protein